MEVAAKLKGAKMSAQKARLVADQIRGQGVGEALNILNFSTKKGAHANYGRRRRHHEADPTARQGASRSNYEANLPYHARGCG